MDETPSENQNYGLGKMESGPSLVGRILDRTRQVFSTDDGPAKYQSSDSETRSWSKTSGRSSSRTEGTTSEPALQGEATPENEGSSFDQGLRLGGNPISDVSTDTDTLHFQPYVDAVAAFLNHEDTTPPITMSVEGEWGSGKSSFMQQVEKRLAELQVAETQAFKSLPRGHGKKAPRGHVSFRFNAWRHDKQDSMWASFALCLTTEVRKRQTLFRRLKGDTTLTVSRLNTAEGWIHLSSVLFLWTILFLISASAVVYIFTRAASDLPGIVGQIVPLLAEKTDLVKRVKPTAFSPALLTLAGRHAALAALLIFALGWKWVSKNLGTRLEWKLKNYLNKPDYESHSAFIEGFHQDFVRIVRAYAGEDRVFVFIDDLDRCDVPRAAELMQAINLMIGDDPHLVFVIGMDREKVAAGIAYKYKDLAPFLRSTVTDADQPSARHPSAFGYSYLEFIQVTFRVPRPSELGVDEFLRSISGSALSESENRKQQASRSSSTRAASSNCRGTCPSRFCGGGRTRKDRRASARMEPAPY